MIEGLDRVCGVQFFSQSVLTGVKSTVDVHPKGLLMFESPRVLGEESELLNDLTECLESFHEIDTNGQIIFCLLGVIVSLPSLHIPLHTHLYSVSRRFRRDQCGRKVF